MSEPISKKVGTKKAAANALRFTCVILRTTKSGLKASFAPANKIPKFLYKYNVTSRNIKLLRYRKVRLPFSHVQTFTKHIQYSEYD